MNIEARIWGHGELKGRAAPLITQEEIENHKRAFLENGGEIQVLPSCGFSSDNPPDYNNQRRKKR